MKKKISRFIGKGSKRDTLVLTLATIVAQSINLLAYPILSRLFTPADFGQFAVVGTFTEVFTAVCTLGYTRMIILAENQQSAANLAVLAIKTGLKSSLLFWLLFLPLSAWLGGVFNDPNFFWWMLLVPIISISVSIFLIYNEWCVYTKQYNRLSINKITNAGANSGTRLLVGLFNLFRSGGLIWSELFGRLFTATEIGITLATNKKDHAVFSATTKEMQRQLAVKYRKNATYMLLSNALNILKQYLPIIFLSIYFGKEFAGYFSMSSYILSVPMLFVGTAVGDVFRQKARENYIKTGSFRPVLLKLVRFQMLIAIPFVILGFFVLDDIIVWVLGERWLIAGEFSLILLPYIAINFFASILMNAFIVTERLKLFWLINFFMFLATLSSLLVGVYLLNSVYQMLLLYTIFLCVVCISIIILAYIHSVDKNFNNHASK
ncbi:MAG: oligosaccharide flippase family protein [Bacteroidota bacterium]